MHRKSFRILHYCVGIFLFFHALIPYAQPNMPYSFKDTHDAARFKLFTETIRCVVCQNQNLADSNAPLAMDLREKIYLMILDRQSDDAINDYLVKRYGEFILLKPRLNSKTYSLWGFPFVGLIMIFLFLRRMIK